MKNNVEVREQTRVDDEERTNENTKMKFEIKSQAFEMSKKE